MALCTKRKRAPQPSMYWRGGTVCRLSWCRPPEANCRHPRGTRSRRHITQDVMQLCSTHRRGVPSDQTTAPTGQLMGHAVTPDNVEVRATAVQLPVGGGPLPLRLPIHRGRVLQCRRRPTATKPATRLHVATALHRARRHRRRSTLPRSDACYRQSVTLVSSTYPRGRLRPRVAIMLRWISEVPPRIVAGTIRMSARAKSTATLSPASRSSLRFA